MKKTMNPYLTNRDIKKEKILLDKVLVAIHKGGNNLRKTGSRFYYLTRYGDYKPVSRKVLEEIYGTDFITSFFLDINNGTIHSEN